MSELVLVVDDDPIILVLTKELLEREGYTPITCPTGEAALEMLKSIEFPLVILDLNLPGISGWEVLDSIDEKEYRTAVMLLTATKTEKLQSFIEANTKRRDLAYAIKPFSREAFLSELERLITKARQKSRLRHLR